MNCEIPMFGRIDSRRRVVQSLPFVWLEIFNQLNEQFTSIQFNFIKPFENTKIENAS